MGTHRARRVIRLGSLNITVVSVAAVLIQLPTAYTDPGQSCAPPPDDVMIAGEAGEPYAAQVTCQNPDGSYSVCTTGTPATGPANCVNYPAAPDGTPDTGADNANSPVPSVLPPPPPA